MQRTIQSKAGCAPCKQAEDEYNREDFKRNQEKKIKRECTVVFMDRERTHRDSPRGEAGIPPDSACVTDKEADHRRGLRSGLVCVALAHGCVSSAPGGRGSQPLRLFMEGEWKLRGERACGVAEATQPFSGRDCAASHTGGGQVGFRGQKSQGWRQQGQLALILCGQQRFLARLCLGHRGKSIVNLTPSSCK